MTRYTTTRRLLVTVTFLGVVLAAPVVGAHVADPVATDPRPADTHPVGAWNGTAHDWNGTVDDRAAWMDARMTDHMGPNGVAWMETRMGVPVDEMAQWMAGDADHPMWGDHTPRVTDGEARRPVDGTHGGPGGEAHRVATDDGRWTTGANRRGMGGRGC